MAGSVIVLLTGVTGVAAGVYVVGLGVQGVRSKFRDVPAPAPIKQPVISTDTAADPKPVETVVTHNTAVSVTAASKAAPSLSMSAKHDAEPPTAESKTPEPLPSKRAFYKAHLQGFYTRGYEAHNKMRLAETDDQLPQTMIELALWLKDTDQWICDNMGTAAFTRFRRPNAIPYDLNWPGEHSPELAKQRNQLLKGSKSLLDNLSELIATDTWDPVDGKPGGCDAK